MIIEIYNKHGKLVNQIFNVTNIKLCNDGRILVYHTEEYSTCHHEEMMVFQVPKGYSIKNQGK